MNAERQTKPPKTTSNIRASNVAPATVVPAKALADIPAFQNEAEMIRIQIAEPDDDPDGSGDSLEMYRNGVVTYPTSNTRNGRDDKAQRHPVHKYLLRHLSNEEGRTFLKPDYLHHDQNVTSSSSSSSSSPSSSSHPSPHPGPSLFYPRNMKRTSSLGSPPREGLLLIQLLPRQAHDFPHRPHVPRLLRSKPVYCAHYR